MLLGASLKANDFKLQLLWGPHWKQGTYTLQLLLGALWPFQYRESPKSCRAFQSYNLPGDWARELSKPSTDSASLVAKIEKNVFHFRWVDFWWWRQKEGIFWKFWPPLAGLGPQPIDPLFWLKVLLKTRSKSASIEPWIDLLVHL